MALIHGGQLNQVAKQYQIPVNQWLDLSTGIAPISYPIPRIPDHVWQNLPQQNDDLLASAKQYYGCENLTVTNGSQAIIKALPYLWRKGHVITHNCPNDQSSGKVFLPKYGYKEHAQAWENAGYNLHYYLDELPPLDALTQHCVLVIINPNNPTGIFYNRKTIMQYQALIQKLNGLLVIDEAFMDVMPKSNSMCAYINNTNTLVFRSFGKFFGLAGIRIGFLIANKSWCNAFNEYLGPWQVNGPAQLIANTALRDTQWHLQQNKVLMTLRNKLECILQQSLGENIIAEIKGTNLFLTVTFNNTINNDLKATKLYNLLFQQAIYVRLTDEKDKLRFGIATDEQLNRLSNALKQICLSNLNTG